MSKLLKSVIITSKILRALVSTRNNFLEPDNDFTDFRIISNKILSRFNNRNRRGKFLYNMYLRKDRDSIWLNKFEVLSNLLSTRNIMKRLT